MLTEFLHRVVAHPAVYDTVQRIVGTSSELERRLATKVGKLDDGAVILDVGGGLGLPPTLWPATATYVCLDIDPVKLGGHRRKYGSGEAILADATRLPVVTGGLDLVVCKNVTHHLTDLQLRALFAESARVLKTGGRMLLLDAVEAGDRWRSRLLWRYDRGSHPRPIETLRRAMAAEFELVEWEVFATHHRYVFGAGITRRTKGFEGQV